MTHHLDLSTATVETYPWDRTEPFVPSPQVSLGVVDATPIGTFDFAAHNTTARVVGLTIGDVSLHTGLSGGDAEIIEVVDRLIEPLHELRQAALRRLAAAESARSDQVVTG